MFAKALDEQKKFFEETLGFSLESHDETMFSVQVGHTKLTFKRSSETHKYHYCFLIPSNKVKESLKWLEARLEPIMVDGSRIVEPTSMWDAESIYFYDGVGNVAELLPALI